jgi:multidrug efflux system membrane fusion protein
MNSPIGSRLAQRPTLIAGVLLSALVLWLGSSLIFPHQREIDQPAKTATTPAPSPVQVSELKAEKISQVVSLSGRTAPARTVEVRAETAGRVVSLGAERGAAVATGSLLVKLDSGDRFARLSQARATVTQRELEYAGQQKLRPQGYVSDAKFAEAGAALQAARTELTRAQIDIQRMQIRAPFAGALQERAVEVGDYLSAGALVATVIDNRKLVVAGSIAENQQPLVRLGALGRARLATGQTVEGRLRYVAPQADAATRTFVVELEIDNSAAKLPVGVTADIELPVGEVLAHRVSPALLTLDEQGLVGVKIVGDDGRVRFVPAVVARSSTEGVWITGLPDPVRLITGGQGFVRPGDAVTANKTGMP